MTISDNKFVNNGLNQFFPGQIITAAAATSLAALGGSSVDAATLAESPFSYLNTNEGPDVANQKDRNALIMLAQLLSVTGQGYKIVYPLDNGTDDAAQIMAALNEAAYKYPIILSSVNKSGQRANFLLASRVTVPSGSTIYGLPGTVVKCTITPDASPQNAAFWAEASTGVATTLAATPTVGTDSVSVTADICAANDYFIIQNGLFVATYKVLSKSGVGPYTYNLDRPIVFTVFASGNAVTRIVDLPKDIYWDGNGMLVSGTATRLFQFSGTNNVHLKNINIDPTYGMATDLVCSFDVGGWQNSFENFSVNCNAVGGVGLALESQEKSLITNCSVRKATASGIVAYDCVFCDIVCSKAFSCATSGILFTADGNTTGCLSCRAISCEAYTNTSSGFSAVNGSSRCQFLGCNAKYNGTGIALGDPSANATANIVDTCDLSANTTGFAQGSTTRNTVISNIDTSGCTDGININTTSDCVISNWTHTGVVTAGHSALLASGVVYLNGFRVVTTGVAIQTLYILGGTCVLSNGFVSSAAGSNVVNAQAGIVKINYTVLTGGGIGLYVNGGTIRRGEHNDLSGCTAEVTYSSGQINEGTVQLNGAAAVNVAFTNMKATDKVILFRTTNAGTPGIAPLVTITANTGFSVTGVALDTSTYTYRIV